MAINFSRVVKSFLLTTGFVVFCCWQAQAVSYYVDYAGGSDSNNGTATNSAWKHCPGDAVATGNAASATLSPGDTVFFKGGVMYVFTSPVSGSPGILLNWSGTMGNPITYDGNSAGNWGTGMAVFTDNHASKNGCAAFSSPNSLNNLVFKNLFIGPLGGAATLPPDPTGTAYAPNGLPPNPGGGISSSAGMNGVVISSCTFSNLGYYGWAPPLGNGSLSGGAVYAMGCNNLIISNCNLTQMRDAIFLDNPRPGTIANLSITGCTMSFIEEWGITMITHTNSYLSNVFICNCLFTNVAQSWTNWTGYGDHPHRDTIFSFGDEGCGGNCAYQRSVTDTNVCIYNNTFVDTLGREGGSGVVWFEDNASANIYNNVFINSAELDAVIMLSEPSTNSLWRAKVYNNTFYISDYSMCLSIGAGPANSYLWPINSSDHSTMIDVQNNLFYEWSGATPYGNSFDFTINSTPNITNNLFLDHNLYRSGQTYVGAPYAGQVVYGYWTECLGYVLPGNVSITGWDKHSLYGDPGFVNASAGNLHLSSTSPVLANGLNLSSLNLPGLAYDRDGNLRPTNGAPWALGAYQTSGTISTNASLPVVQGLHVVSYN